MIKYLLENKAYIDDSSLDFLNWYFIQASKDGNLDDIKFFLKHGVYVDVSDEHGDTALIHAVENNHLDVVKYLVWYGADVNNRRNNLDESPIEFSCMKGHLEILKYFIDSGADPNKVYSNFGFETTFLMIACLYNQLDIVKYLIDISSKNCINVNFQSKDGYTALMHCTIRADNVINSDIIKYLIENGADINIQNKDGMTALMLASKYGYLDVVKQLIDHGALMELRNNKGETAKDLAETDDIIALFE